ncbi:hypothetical protein MNBD_BACTEROID05-190 [hydrothermal vent metagenome]|uniref:DNA helicase Holliday junction RuvA type domain-containing protein n=1 Tax=hydrothermal vent metagenome TaxID=652676 RepID=A0A3B0U5T9_9ZZZZ
MIVRISGKFVEKKEQAVIINVGGISYEIMTAQTVMDRIDETQDEQGNVNLVIYQYLQINQASALPTLIGFISEVERDFFLQFIKVSGIGPRAAVKALNQPISQITRAIDEGDIKYLKTLSGIGLQRAKEIVAKLQGKVARFGLIQDKDFVRPAVKQEVSNWQQEVLSVLLQLQYKKNEAIDMMDKALLRDQNIKSAEELLNAIYKQKVSV